jgi:signal transduction histidine kinase/DNA-binding response OmpR family regulator
MGKAIHVLYIDDYALDRELVRDALERAEHGAFRVTMVASRPEFEERLVEGEYDLVLSDFNVLGSEGLAVIEMVHKQDPLLPVVIVTGTGSEEMAAEAMKQGAAEYVIKTHQHIRRLPHVIQGVLERERAKQERTQARQALGQRAAQLALLNDVGRQIAAELDLDSLINRAVQLVQDAFGYHHVGLFLLHGDQGLLTMRASAGPYAALFPHPHRLRMGQGMVGWVGQHGEILLANDVTTEPRYVPTIAGALGPATQAELSVPIRTGQQVLGVLDVQSPQRNAFNENDVAVLETLAAQIAVAISNARLYRQVQVELIERRRMEAERERLLAHIGEQARRLQQVVDAVPQGVLLLDAGFRVVLANPVARSHLDILAGSWVGSELAHLGNRPLADLLAPPSAGGWHELLVGARVFEIVAQPLASEGPSRGWVLVTRDVTSERQVQQQMVQQERLAAVGQLSGGIAHDFNNILTVIQLSIRLLEREIQGGHPLWPHVERIRVSGNRATSLVKQLLSFSRREVVEPRQLDLNEHITELEKMLRRIIGEDIELKTSLAENLWPVVMDPAQVDQVVMNLAVNARDAMPQGGTLIIETSNVILDEAYAARYLSVEPGEYVLLTISDTGVGMSAYVKSRIFEPFFTTKEWGKGTGLGLATVYGIVKQNEGHIGVYSEIGQGTVFKIYLPRLEQARVEMHSPQEPATRDQVMRGNETILLVEDAEDLRKLSAGILADLGYQVLIAQDGHEALAIAEQHDGPIHLLLSDVVMPGMSGPDLADRLRAQRPETRVILMSGYANETLSRHGVLINSASILTKPLTLERLTEKVRQVLDGEM